MKGSSKIGKTVMEKQSDVKDELIHHRKFQYRINYPNSPSGEIVILLHGSGGDENTLIPFARSIWPDATLAGFRGRLVQNGERRWFKKISPIKFDQKDAIKEADAFVKFLTELARNTDCDLSQAIFVGYSNGANLLAIVLARYPELVRRAILMRSMPVLDAPPSQRLDKTKVLVISGKRDSLYLPFASTLISLLEAAGAKVESCLVESDHMIGAADADVIRTWINT